MTLLTFAAVALSALCLVLLCRGDPKRRRSARLPGAGQRTATRRALTAASIVPGVLCAANGAAAFLLWLGGYAVAGWLVSLAFAPRPASGA